MKHFSAERRRQFIASMLAELEHGYAKHGSRPWSRHEFYAVVKEEVDEAWDAIKRDEPIENVLKEIMQVAAVCLRFAETPESYRGEHPLPLPCRLDMETALHGLAKAVEAIGNPESDDAACMRMIHALRADEGDSVEVLCDNPDSLDELDNNAILCSGDWTQWVIRRFRGKSLRAALEAACEARGGKA